MFFPFLSVATRQLKSPSVALTRFLLDGAARDSEPQVLAPV